MPVPAGPIPKVTTLVGDRVRVHLLPGGLRMHRPSACRAQQLAREHVRRPDVVFHHRDRAFDVGRVEPVALLEQQDQFVEEPPDKLGILALDGDLVASHHDERA